MRRSSPAMFLFALAATAGLMTGPAATLSNAPPAARLQGTWDLQWKTRRGLTPGGHMVISQKGERFRAKLHGRGSIDASGTLEGDRFVLRGSRMLVPYRMTGIVRGDTIEGSLKVMSVERHFIGRRRN